MILIKDQNTDKMKKTLFFAILALSVNAFGQINQPAINLEHQIFTRYTPQGRAVDPASRASPGELTLVPIPRPLPCWQGRGAGEGYELKRKSEERNCLPTFRRD